MFPSGMDVLFRANRMQFAAVRGNSGAASGLFPCFIPQLHMSKAFPWPCVVSVVSDHRKIAVAYLGPSFRYVHCGGFTAAGSREAHTRTETQEFNSYNEDLLIPGYGSVVKP